MKKHFFPDLGVTIEAPTRKQALAKLKPAGDPAGDGVESKPRKKRASSPSDA
jgi:hypothetical protein